MDNPSWLPSDVNNVDDLAKMCIRFQKAFPGRNVDDFLDLCYRVAQTKRNPAEHPPVPENISPELQKMIEEMYKNTPAHTDVYPPKPRKGSVVVPTGGLARCQCSPDCTKELMEPAYMVIETDENEEIELVVTSKMKKKIMKSMEKRINGTKV